MEAGIRVSINLIKQPNISMKWLFDAGAAVAVTNCMKNFIPGTFVREETVFGTSEMTGTLEVEGYGEVKLTLKCVLPLTISNVCYCSKASVNLMTNVKLDPQVRFIIDVQRRYLWVDEQDENGYVEFCKEIDGQNVIQLREEKKINVVTRSGKSSRNEEPQFDKRTKIPKVKSVVYTKKDSVAADDGQESVLNLDQEISMCLSENRFEPEEEERDLREVLNEKQEVTSKPDL